MMSHNAQIKGIYKPGVSCLEVEATDFIYEQLTKSAKGVDVFKAFGVKNSSVSRRETNLTNLIKIN